MRLTRWSIPKLCKRGYAGNVGAALRSSFDLLLLYVVLQDPGLKVYPALDGITPTDFSEAFPPRHKALSDGLALGFFFCVASQLF